MQAFLGLVVIVFFFGWLHSLDWSWFWSLLKILGWISVSIVGIIAAFIVHACIIEIKKPKLSIEDQKKLEAESKVRKAEGIARTNAMNKQRAAKALAKINWNVEIHKNELLGKRRQYIEDKGYDIIDKSKWETEKLHFINAILRVKAKDFIAHCSDDMLKNQIENRLDELASKATEAPPMGKPIEFEHFCASELERAGWHVNTTKASGDQGADVIAKKSKVKVVLQCKQYSKPVGNAAVQEAHSAKAHYSADFAAVVTNKSYTKSAKQLAASTGVLLLHQDELADLDSLL